MSTGNPSKADIKVFWESEPLFTGEVPHDPFSREFVRAHEQIYRSDVFAGRGFPDEFFPFAPDARVLDVGCGPGIWTRELARRGYRVSAIDLTSAAVALAKNSLELLGLKADIQEGDAENLPFADASFDGVVSHGVIHHTPDTAKCVREMARILRPGGTAVVSVYYRNLVLRSKLLSRLAALVLSGWVALPGRGREDQLTCGDAKEIVRRYDGARNPLGKAFTAAELRAMFEQSGFRIMRMQRYYFPRRAFGALGRALAPLHAALARRFGLMIALIAQKPLT
jgi:2-polyprenyl-3-methyl-5-hydroxy-6-metoxy-1,4-benzoquinol methylase